MWNPFKRKPIKEPTPTPDPNRVLIAVSRPGVYRYTATIGYKKERVDLLIRLYMTGAKRSWAAFESGQEVAKVSAEMDFWVDTGKFADDDTEKHFEWILSVREQKKKLLAELIKMDADPPKETTNEDL